MKKMEGQLAVSTPKQYLAALDEPRRTEVAKLDAFVRKTVPRLAPFIHAGMLAYGPFRYRSKSGREGDWFKIGIASNQAAISLYACAADERGYVAERYRDELPHANIGKSCIRIKHLADLDLKVLGRLLKETEKIGFGVQVQQEKAKPTARSSPRSAAARRRTTRRPG